MTDAEWDEIVNLVDLTNSAISEATYDDFLVLDFKTCFKKYERACGMCFNVAENHIELVGMTTNEEVINKCASYKDAKYYLSCFRLMRPLME